MPLRRWLVHGIFAASASAFVSLAVYRRLNFDEALALRAGWLELGRFDAAPAFVMPWTLLVGGLARLVDDPGHVFLLSRLVAVLGVLAAFVFAVHRAGLQGVRAPAAGLLLLSQAGFVTHGLEFRYDAAILIGLLVLFASVVPASAERPWLGGFAVAVVALHHLKGFALALVLGVWCVWLLRERRRLAGRFVASAVATIGVFGLLVIALDLGERWFETIRGFWALARSVSRAPLAETLGPAMMRDLGWWTFAAAGVLAGLWGARDARSGGTARTLLVFSAATLGFVLVHPHPWPYMLALPAPFVSIAATAHWPARGLRSRAGRLWAVAAVGALALQWGLGRGAPHAAWHAAIEAPRAQIDASLRSIKAAVTAGERILDPSGLVYFLPPCDKEWYLDALFSERVRAGHWMTRLEDGVPSECRLVLSTYRLGALPEAARRHLARDFTLLPMGLAVRINAMTEVGFAELASRPQCRIESFW